MKKHYLVGYKVFFGLLGFSALVTEYAVLWATNILNPANFFSFFTVESNIIAAAIFLIGAFYTFANKNSTRFDFFRGAATFYMLVTGIVFAVLLSGLEGARLTAVPWDNIVLHYIVPIAIIFDWVVDPPLKRIALKKALIWLAFPLAYLVYSLVRGPIVHWYPYPFLNPVNGGYGRIALLSIAILILGILLVSVISWISGKKK